MTANSVNDGEVFDVEVFVLPKSRVLSDCVLTEVCVGLNLVGVGQKEACNICAQIAAAGGSGRAVPVKYRSSRVERTAARQIAQMALDQIVARRANHRIGPLEENGETQMTWAFRADDFTLQEQDWAPGAYSFEIDRLDGHLWSEEECRASWWGVLD